MKRRTAQSTRSGEVLLRTMLSRLKVGRDLRKSKVRRVRRSVREQSYENELKLQVAIERLARELES